MTSSALLLLGHFPGADPSYEVSALYYFPGMSAYHYCPGKKTSGEGIALHNVGMSPTWEERGGGGERKRKTRTGKRRGSGPMVSCLAQVVPRGWI